MSQSKSPRESDEGRGAQAVKQHVKTKNIKTSFFFYCLTFGNFIVLFVAHLCFCFILECDRKSEKLFLKANERISVETAYGKYSVIIFERETDHCP